MGARLTILVSPVTTLSALDLSAERRDVGGDAYRIEIGGEAEVAEMLIVGDRAGVAWGADAEWTDVLPGEKPIDVATRMLA